MDTRISLHFNAKDRRLYYNTELVQVTHINVNNYRIVTSQTQMLFLLSDGDVVTANARSCICSAFALLGK